MKAPDIYRMIWNERSVCALDTEASLLFNEIMGMLDGIEPMRGGDWYKRVWLSEERGTVRDMCFTNVEEAMEYFDVDSAESLQETFEKEFPEQRYWFLLEANSLERYMSVGNLTIFPEQEDSSSAPRAATFFYPCTLAGLLRWIREALQKDLDLARRGEYVSFLEKELPYTLRYGTISRRELYKRRPFVREEILKDLTDNEIGRFLQILNTEGKETVPTGRVRDMTFDIYFEFASVAYAAVGYDIVGLSPYEQLRRYGEDFGGNLLAKLPHNTSDGFLYYYDEKNHMGGHPWGLRKGSSRTRLYLYPCLTESGFYFRFGGNENYMTYELVKMFLALKDSGIPVSYSGNRENVRRILQEEDSIGVVPVNVIPLYQEREFPEEEVHIFTHFRPNEDEDIADTITWQSFLPIVEKAARG